MFDNASKHIRLSFYGHYQPTFGINLISQDGDIESSTAFCNMFNRGGKLVYRRISFGIEKQWGESKQSSRSGNENFLTYFRFLSSHTTICAVRHTAV